MKKFLLSFFSASAIASVAWADAVPYSQTFDSQADFNTLTLYHDSSDSKDWGWSSSAARFYPSTRYNSYDAWFFLPSLTLEAGKQYIVTFTTKISSSGSSNYKDLSVNIGGAATTEGQTELWRENIQSSSYTSKKVSFSVLSDGDYVVGFRTNATSGSMNDIYVDDIKIDVYKELPAAVADASATPGEKGALEVTLQWTNPDTNDGGSALSALSGVKIYRTDSSWVGISDQILVATVTDGIAVGETSTWTDTQMPASGNYYYYIVPFNENGDSPAKASSIKSGYVGPDTGLSATKNVVAAAVPGNEKAVSLTWDAPVGTNGGYVDLTNVAWRITRNGSTTVTLEDSWKGELPYNYVDNSITGLDSYTYTVQYIADGKTETTGSKSNAVVTGGTADLPYSQTFSSSNALDLFSNFSGEASSNGTKWNKPTSSNFVQVAQTTGTYDAWLVTPPFQLKDGAYYDLSFDVSSSSAKTKSFEVMLGQAPTATNLTTSLLDEDIALTTSAVTKSVRFKADADSRFHIGFHLKGAANAGYFRLSNIKLEEVIIAPVAITDFTATAADDDALSVDLAWTNPTTDVIGSTLSSISKVEVLRGNEVIKVYNDAVPGQNTTLTDEPEAPGSYIYSVISYLGDNASAPATAKCKVGGAMALPYTADFSSADTFTDWTLPADASGSAWTYDTSSSRLEAPDKDGMWLFTPEFKAKKGTVTLSLSAAIRSTTYKETVKVALYKEADPAAQAAGEQVSYTFASTTASPASFELEVPETGVYTIGISRPKSGWNLYISGTTIVQTASVSETAPASVSDLSIAGDADDDSKVIISWTNPDKTQTDAPLAAISKIEILRDDTLIATLTDDLTPGAPASYTDVIDAAGKYTYSVTVYVGEESSSPVTALSPFVGGAFYLPYEVEFSSASDVDYWTLPENANGRAWKFETNSSSPYRTGLVAGSNGLTAFTIPFNAQKGEITTTIDAYCYNYRNLETLKVGLFSTADAAASPIGEWQEFEISATSYADKKTATFSIPEAGKYFVGFYIETSKMYCYLHGISIEQSKVAVKDIVVLWNNTDAQFGTPTVEVDGIDYVMTCTGDIALMTNAEGNSPILFSNAFYATIPGDAAKVTFKDTAEGAAPISYDFDEPKHLWIYSPDGGKEFDENQLTGIEDIESDNRETTRYFDLRGVEVATPRSGNVYIILSGNRATKQLIK